MEAFWPGSEKREQVIDKTINVTLTMQKQILHVIVIFPPSPFHPVNLLSPARRVVGVSRVCPSCDGGKAGFDPGQVSSLSQGHIQRQTAIRTPTHPYGQCRSPSSTSMPVFGLWGKVGGTRSTLPIHKENTQRIPGCKEHCLLACYVSIFQEKNIFLDESPPGDAHHLCSPQLNPESDLPAGLERPECQWCVKYHRGILAQGNQDSIELQTLPEEALTDERWRPLGVWPPWVTASNRTDPLQASAALLYIIVCVVEASVQIIAVHVLAASFWMGRMSGHVQGNMAKYLKAT